ncbi:hypothetical protein [Streptomyces sp. NPDC054837]
MSTNLAQQSKATWILVVLLASMVAALSAGILGSVLGTGLLGAVVWAGGTFIAVAGLGLIILAFVWS